MSGRNAHDERQESFTPPLPREELEVAAELFRALPSDVRNAMVAVARCAKDRGQPVDGQLLRSMI